MEDREETECKIKPFNPGYMHGWNDAIEAAIEAVLDIGCKGSADGDTLLRARYSLKELKR